MVRAGTTPLVVGVGAIVGYWLYVLFGSLYIAGDVPLLVRIAIPVALLGLVLLIAALAWERIRARKRECFEEVEY